ncbi:MAG: hypothetical protein ACKOPS_09430, partial [Cyanobium sp.]
LLKAWLIALGQDAPRSHDIARLLLLLQASGVDVSDLFSLRAFTAYAVQSQALLDRVESQLS